MCHVRAVIATNDAVPRWIVLFVELLLDVSRNIFLNVISEKAQRAHAMFVTLQMIKCLLFERLSSAFDCFLLHFLRHVGVLNNCLAIAHFRLLRLFG